MFYTSLSVGFGYHPPVIILAQIHIPSPDLPKLQVYLQLLIKHWNVHRLFKNEVSKMELIIFLPRSVFPPPCILSRNLASPDLCRLSQPLHPKGYNILTVLPLDGCQVCSQDPIASTLFGSRSGSQTLPSRFPTSQSCSLLLSCCRQRVSPKSDLTTSQHLPAQNLHRPEDACRISSGLSLTKPATGLH